MEIRPRLILFARYPVPGECKTRLIPAVGPEGAAAIHRQLAQRTAELLRTSGCEVTVAITGADPDAFARWLGAGMDFVPQTDGDLTDRLLPFVDHAPVIFFGSDTPDLSASHIDEAVRALVNSEVVIGPAEDGGYYLIGMQRPLPELLTDMLWSTDQVLPETLRRLEQMGIAPHLLETLSDCDTPEDLARWPELTA
ncbi:MAG: TIGR04282 family arsenosugar biosynthesis glycosyltransferase [Pseudomonadota bacterium]|nr:TIGR04282 family arsenosugar biosynthesis glycosyltransferase [Pseudomonadota bacterium]